MLLESSFLSFGGLSFIDSKPLKVKDFNKDYPPMLLSEESLDIVFFFIRALTFDLLSPSYSVEDHHKLLLSLSYIQEFLKLPLDDLRIV